MSDDADRKKTDERLLRLAGEILDGGKVDWSAAGEESAAALADDLRAIEVLTRLGHGPSAGQWGSLRLIESVGSGAYGEVFRAWDPRLDREVALKLLRAPGPADQADTTTIEEGRLLARVRHPNVVTVFGAESIDGRIGIWTEFIHGETLAARVSRAGPLSAGETIAIGMDICSALSAIHQAGVVHGDVKAQNVMQEPGGRTVLVDLGTGREHLQDVAAAETAHVSGTPLYLAPELWRRESPTPASDVYSLGVLLYFMVTGTYPVQGATTQEVREAHAAGRRRTLRQECPRLPLAFTAAVDRALSVNRSDRFSSAGAFREALERASPALARRRRRITVLSIVVIAAIAGAAELGRRFTQHPDNPAPPVGGHVATQLTFRSPAAGTLVSAISPDGVFIAYADQAGLHAQRLHSPDSLSLSLPPSGGAIQDLAWLPDSTAVIVTNGTGVWRVSAVNQPTSVRRITDIAGLIAVSPDGRELALRDTAGTRMLRLPVGGGEPVEIVPAEQGVSIYKPAWSPDGRRFAYARHWSGGRGVVTRKHDGSDPAMVEVVGVESVAWAPDHRLLFSYRKPEGYSELYAINTDPVTGRPTGQAPALVISDRTLNFGRPTITRDGRRMVFTLSRPRREAYTAEFDETRRILSSTRRESSTSGRDDGVAWTSSGDILLRAGDSAAPATYRQHPGGTERQSLLPPGLTGVERAVLSPDEQAVIYVQSGRLMRQPVGGGEPTKLLDLAAAYSWPQCAYLPSVICVVGSQFSRSNPLAAPYSFISIDPLAPGKAQSHGSLPTAHGAWSLSPDGRRVAAIDLSDKSGGLLIMDLRSNVVERFRSQAAAGANFIAWAAKGWFVAKVIGPGGEMYYVDRAGRATTLWSRKNERLTNQTVSPDGRRIMFTLSYTDTNVWMLDRF